MQHSLTVFPVKTNLLITSNCTQCTVSADIVRVYTIKLLYVHNNLNQNILHINDYTNIYKYIWNIMPKLNSTYCYTVRYQNNKPILPLTHFTTTNNNSVQHPSVLSSTERYFQPHTVYSPQTANIPTAVADPPTH